MNNEIIKIENLDFSYPNNPVLKDLNLTIHEGDLTIIIGENGSGKSTLLKLMLGELKADNGVIEVFNKNINDIEDFKRIGYVPQVQVMNQMGFPVSCLELVSSGLYFNFGFIKIPKEESKKRAKEVLEAMGLKDYINTPISELSGGLKQRTMIARALVQDPKLIILDEPTAGVDQESKDQLMELIKEMAKDKEKTFIIVSHEMDYMKKNLEDSKIYRIKGGRAYNA